MATGMRDALIGGSVAAATLRSIRTLDNLSSMKMDPSSPTRPLIRQLLAREIGAAEGPDAVGAAISGLCSRVSENLRRSLGNDGRDALLERALTRAQPQHPVLIDIGRIEKTGVSLDIVAGINTHGVSAVSAAVESLLATLADILGGLIGADMVMNLLDHDGQPSKAPTAVKVNDHG